MIKLLILCSLFFSVGCAQIQSGGVAENTATYPNNLIAQRQLVKELDVQQRTSGSFELCSETGVWKCKEVTKKTVITSSSVTSDSPTQEVLNEEWLIQVGAYKTEGAVERAVDAFDHRQVGEGQLDNRQQVAHPGFGHQVADQQDDQHA